MTTPRVTVPVEDLTLIEKKLRHGGWPSEAKKVRGWLSAAPAPEGGAVSDLRRLLGNAICYGCSRRYGDNSEAAIKDARGCVSCTAARSALATREEAPASLCDHGHTDPMALCSDCEADSVEAPAEGAGEDVNWKAEYEAACEARISDRQKSQEVINERDKWVAELLQERAALSAQPQAREDAQPVGWLRAVDEEMVCAHLGVADAEDSFETAKKKLASLIQWNIAVATDPSVGGYTAPSSLAGGEDSAFKVATDLHAAYEALIYGLPKYLEAENLTDEENMIREAWITLDVTAHRLVALATREEAPDWTARTEAAWAENNREEALAEAGEVARACADFQEAIDYFEADVADVMADGSERADLWDREIMVNIDALKTVMAAALATREEAPADNVTILITRAQREAAKNSGKKLNDWIGGILQRAVEEAPAEHHERNLAMTNAELIEQALSHPPLEAPAEAGEDVELIAALRSMPRCHCAGDDWPSLYDRAADRLEALRAQPQAREDAQPVGLTAAQLADAIDWFWNAALGASRERQTETAADVASVMVSGMAAVAQGLRETAMASAPPPP